MTARTARRISQPDSRCVPNRNAVLNKKNVVALPRLPHGALRPVTGRVLSKKTSLPCRDYRIHAAFLTGTPCSTRTTSLSYRATTACAASAAQARPARSSAARIEGWSNPIRTLPQLQPRPFSTKKRGRRATTTCAASSATTAARLPRGQNPKGRSNPDRTAAAASAVAVLNKNGVDAPLPLAQLHPRNALPRVSLAARIRKAGRCLTAPLARRHSAQVLGVSASASCRAHAQKLIDGTAIKSRANRRRFSNLQISNRR